MKRKPPVQAFETSDSEDENKLSTQTSSPQPPAREEDSRLTRIKGAGKALLGTAGLGALAGACIATGGLAFLPLVIAAVVVPEIINKPASLLYGGLKETITGKKAETPIRDFASQRSTMALGAGKIALGIGSILAAVALTVATGGWFAAPIIVAGLINKDIITKPFKLIYSGCKDLLSAKNQSNTGLPNQNENNPSQKNSQPQRSHETRIDMEPSHTQGIGAVNPNRNLPPNPNRGDSQGRY